MVVVAALASTLGISAANAEERQGPTPDAIALADERGYLIIDSSDGVHTSNGTFYATGELDEGTLVVISEPDGSLPGGITEADLATLVAARRSGDSSTPTNATSNELTDASIAPMSLYGWSANVSGWSGVWTGGSVWGWDPSAEVSYYFETSWWTYQTAVGQGLGYYEGYNGSQFGIWSKWYGLGSADSGGGGGVVPWGEVIGTKKFRAQCVNTATCSGGWE